MRLLVTILLFHNYEKTMRWNLQPVGLAPNSFIKLCASDKLIPNGLCYHSKVSFWIFSVLAFASEG